MRRPLRRSALHSFVLRFLESLERKRTRLSGRSAASWERTSREMLVISRQNGLRLLSSRLSGYRQKLDGHALIGRCAVMICTDRLRIKLKDLRGGVPVGRFFPFIFVGSCIVRTFCICRSPHGLFSCLLRCV